MKIIISLLVSLLLSISNLSAQVISIENYTLFAINNSSVDVPPGFNVQSYTFVKGRDTVIINYRTFTAIFAFGKDFCVLKTDTVYSLKYKKVCKEKVLCTRNNEKCFYNYVTFVDSCSKFKYLPISKMNCSKKRRYEYPITNFIDLNNEIFEILEVRPCHTMMKW